MGGFSSKHWNEMLEVQEMEEKEKEKAGKKRTPLLDKRTKVLRTDPRSASEGVDRTPIAVERQNDLDTPVLLSYSPLLPTLKTLAMDPRSPSDLERTPIVVEEERPSRNTGKDMLRRVLNANDSPSSSTPIRSSLESSNSLESSTTSTPVMSPCITGEVGKKCDRDQPRKLSQNQFRDNLEALCKDEFSSGAAGDQVGGTYTEDKVLQTPPATGGLVSGTCDATNLVSGTPPAEGDLVNGTPPAAGDFVSGTAPAAGDVVSGTKPSAGDMVSGTPPAVGDMESGTAPSAGDLVSGILPVAGI